MKNLNFKCVIPDTDAELNIRKLLNVCGFYCDQQITGNMFFAMRRDTIIPNDQWYISTNNPSSFCTLDVPLFSYEDVIEMLKKDAAPSPKFDIKVKDEILVRDTVCLKWRYNIFSHAVKEAYFMTVGGAYSMLIPFKGNEHLIGTIETPKNGFWLLDGSCIEPKWVK